MNDSKKTKEDFIKKQLLCFLLKKKPLQKKGRVGDLTQKSKLFLDKALVKNLLV